MHFTVSTFLSLKQMAHISIFLCLDLTYICIHTHTYVYIHIYTYILFCRSLLVAQLVKNLPARWETWIQSLGQEDPLEKRMAAHFSILAWKISWTEELSGL